MVCNNFQGGYYAYTTWNFFKKIKIRLWRNSGEIMKEMSVKLNVSSSFLSAVENGKKKMPDSWYDMIIDLYNLDKDKQDELMTAIEESQMSVEINLENLCIEKISIFVRKRIEKYE